MSHTELGIGGLIALIVTITFMLVSRSSALRLGWADSPGGRKKHDARVPLIGGVAMAVGLSAGSGFVAVPAFWSVAALSVWLLVVVGAADDRFDLPPAVRLTAQAVAASLVVFSAGVVIRDLGAPLLFPVSMGELGPLFTVLLIMTVVNGFNLVDGIDGLAGGVAFLSLAAIGCLAAGTEVLPLAVVLAMAVAGFLTLNLPFRVTRRARVFMGDAGSTMLGFVIACLGIVLTQGEGAPIAPVVMLWIVGLPVYELLAAVRRRIEDGCSPWAADDQHLHHSLLARGISPRRTLAFMLLLASGMAATGVAAHWAELPDALMFAGWIVGAVLYYRVTRRPKPVAKWVHGWKASRSFEMTFVETVVLQPVGGEEKGGSSVR